jgi:hypothetical protein
MKKAVDTSIDTTLFDDLLSEADKAYRADVSYAIAVCGAARSIESKRKVWQLRLELREAAKKAQYKCSKVSPFKCENVSPCGLGSCRFAEGEMTLLTLRSPGSTIRPQEDSMEPYGLEGAVDALRELREDSTDADF